MGSQSDCGCLPGSLLLTDLYKESSDHQDILQLGKTVLIQLFYSTLSPPTS